MTTLNFSRDEIAERKSEKFEVLGSLKIDVCCYVDPLDNCESLAPSNLRHRSNHKCITNLGKYKIHMNKQTQ